ncbi:MAG TPA: AMP-binding protein [Burkholderiales bacterium]|nr:AMP-binding protein [Burkholderiales bacterium]
MSSIRPGELDTRVERLSSALIAARPRVRVVGLIADNGPGWVIADLAAQQAGVVLVPLPAFFTPAQIDHAVRETGMDSVIGAPLPGFAAAGEIEGLPWWRRTALPAAFPRGTSKVTFTSGTTAVPKGLPLSTDQQRAVANSLVHVTRHVGLKRHLCLLPLAVLLENVAGVYAPLAAGMEICVPPLAQTGLRGSSDFDPLACLAAIEKWQADSVILLPQMLAALAAAIEGGAPAPKSLWFAAVGGAKVSSVLILRARALGLAVYEGYGLSECASVVALNVPGADKVGSVGKVLPHLHVEIRDEEIEVKTPHGWRATGDLGRIDDEGFLYVHGRRKHVLITSYGRNVSPEWPEAELVAGPAIVQAAVFGEAQPRLCALVVPAAGASASAVEAQVRAANARLPDYAQIGAWVRADAPFTAQNGLATANGRARREVLWQRYAERLDGLF